MAGTVSTYRDQHLLYTITHSDVIYSKDMDEGLVDLPADRRISVVSDEQRLAVSVVLSSPQHT